jgi:hypothetical protein
MIHVLRVLAAAGEVQNFCQDRAWRFCFIGGVAVQRWAEPRLTQDADLTLLTGFGNEESFIDPLLQWLEPRRPDAREFAVRQRVLLGRTPGGVDVDIALGGLPFEERCVERSSTWEWTDGETLITCSAEDLVIHKVFAGRGLDWTDAERVLIRQHGKLDLKLIRTELKSLLELKDEMASLDKLETTIATVERRLRAKP